MTDKPLPSRKVFIKRSDPNKTALRLVKGDVPPAVGQKSTVAQPEPGIRESIVNQLALGKPVTGQPEPEQPPQPQGSEKVGARQLRSITPPANLKRSFAAIISGGGLFKTQQGRFIVGGVCLFLLAGVQALVPNFHKKPAPELATINRGIAVEELLGEKGLKLGLTRRNPPISWFEKTFCRGSKVAGGCSDAVYHPYLTWWENYAETEYIDEKDRGQALKTIAKTFKKKPEFNKYRERNVLLAKGRVEP